MEDFCAVYRECYPHVLAYAASHAGAQRAEDITSETFTIAWRKLDQMPPNALPWLLGIARNLVKAARRQAWHGLTSVEAAQVLGCSTNGREGLAGVVPTQPRFQFSNVETQLIIAPKTYSPLMIRDVVTSPQHGLAASTAISSVEFLAMGPTTGEPHVPAGVVVNGEVESPIIER